MASGNEVYRAGLGPTFLTGEMLKVDRGSFGFIVATTDDDGASPPVNNCYWIQEITTTFFDVGPGSAFVALDYEWPVIEAHRIEGTTQAAQSEERVVEFELDAGNDVRLNYDPLAGSTFRYRLSQIGGGASAYGASGRATSTNYSLRFQFDGTNAKLWVDDVLDISIAVSGKPTLFFHLGSTLPAGVEQYWCGLCWRGSDTESDRPNTTLTIEGPNAASDNESAQYGGQAGAGVDCSDAAKGLWSNWDDDGADDSDRTIWNCTAGGTNAVETSHFDTVNMSDPKLVQIRYLSRGSIAAKMVETYARIVNGTPVVSEVEHINIGDGNWRGNSRAFPLDANGDPWTKLRVNDTRAGVRSVNTNTANDDWSFMRVEVFDLGDDPPTVGVKRNQGTVIA